MDKMTLFDVKMTIITMLGHKANKENAEELYKWVLEDIDPKAFGKETMN